LKTLSGGPGTNYTAVAFDPKGMSLAAGSGDGTIVLWDLEVPNVPRKFEGRHSKGKEDGTPAGQRFHFDDPDTDASQVVRNLAFSRNGRILASGDQGGTFILWDVASRQPLVPPTRRHKGMVSGLAFSPDGRFFLSSGEGNAEPVLWTLDRDHIGPATPLVRPAEFYSGLGGGVRDLACSVDGRLVAWTQKAAKIVTLWDLSENRPIGPDLTGFDGVIAAMRFVRGDRAFMAADIEGNVLRWDIDVHSLAHRACRVANRNFSRNEWSYFFGSHVPYRRICIDLPPGEGVMTSGPSR
jgi:WD40 repeat protein